MNDYTDTFRSARKASKKIQGIGDEMAQKVLLRLAKLSMDQIPMLLAANQKDLQKMSKEDPKYDRLLLDEPRLKSICHELLQVANLPSPLDQNLEERTLSNGLVIKKVSVPLGILGIIYEARPNVTFDVFALAIKSGNGLILKGGSDATHSNLAIMSLIHEALEVEGLPKEAFQLLPPDRTATAALLEAVGFVDILIPRGSQALIDYVRSNAKVPVIETGAGIVHTYFDKSGDLEKGRSIIFNAKTRRPSVCNSLDCLLVHENRLADLMELIEPMKEKNVKIFADALSYPFIQAYPNLAKANPEHFGTEFLSLTLAIKTVGDLDEALQHIDQYSSKHSEAIIAEDEATLDKFLQSVDAAAVYANASTAFTDGNQFGMGSEIGISTQKLHARGPMALKELTTYKWIIKGEGHIRN